jgi:hypothetical protein
MQEFEKNIDDLRNDLFSGKPELVITTIQTIKQTSHYEIIDSLFDLYLTTQKDEIRSAILDLFIDIKDQRFVEKLIESLGKPKFTAINKELISICWQTGLDFSNHIDMFLSKMFDGTDEIAIECFSVIESSIDILSDEKKQSLKTFLNEKKNDFDGVKKGLIEEAVYMLA